jgi:3-hydroxypropanoate dehydrogenase
MLREIYDIAKFGPTSMNTQPMRLLFLRTAAANERLKPYLAPGNVDKTMAAPVTVIVGHDFAFYEHLPTQFPHNPNAKGVFVFICPRSWGPGLGRRRNGHRTSTASSSSFR